MFESNYFTLRQAVTPALLALLEETTLGTNGAKYRHLDTNSRIFEADNPLFLSLERNGKVLGNVTFCRREEYWYVRYFAFAAFAQASANKVKSRGANSILKTELNQFFDGILAGNYSSKPVKGIYAYIDARNARSKWMSENFGFEVVGKLVTQSFSRLHPRQSNRLQIVTEWSEIESFCRENYANHRHFYTHHCSKPPFYVIRDTNGAILASMKVTKANWVIERFPGKFGSILPKLVRFIPVLNQVLTPQKLTFLVPDLVYVKGNNAQLLDELFQSVLYAEKCKLIFWWVDKNDQLFCQIRQRIRWGILHLMLGITEVDIVEKRVGQSVDSPETPEFVSAYDMI